jgi:hypothetical protein
MGGATAEERDKDQTEEERQSGKDIVPGGKTPDPTVKKSAFQTWLDESGEYLLGVFTDSPELIELWVELETTWKVTDGKQRLATKHRPPEIALWISRTRSYANLPTIENCVEYGSLWRGWWKLLQPEWRVEEDSDWPLSREVPDGEKWESLSKGGANGLFVVLMSLSWWVEQAKDHREKREAESAVEDVQWVLEQIHEAMEGDDKGDGLGMDIDSDGIQGGNGGGKKRQAEEDLNQRPAKKR